MTDTAKALHDCVKTPNAVKAMKTHDGGDGIHNRKSRGKE